MSSYVSLAANLDLLSPGDLSSFDSRVVLQQLLDAMPDVAAAYTPYFYCLACNESCVALFEAQTGLQIQPGQNMQTALEHFCEEPGQLHDNWNRVLHGEYFTVLCEFEPRSYAQQVYEIAYRPLCDTEGHPVGIIQIIRNVSPAPIIERDYIYRTLIHTMAEGALVYDTNLVIRDANTHAEQLFGRTCSQLAELTRKHAAIGLIDEDGTLLPTEAYPAAVVLRTRQPVSGMRIGVYRPDGTLTWVVVHAWPLALRDTGRPHAVVVTCTPQVEQRSLLTSILNASLEGIVALKSIRDADGQIVDFTWSLVNPQAEKILHQPSAALIGRSLHETMRSYRHLGLFNVYKQVVETGVSSSQERWYNHDHMRGWFHSTVVRLDDGCVVIFRDITLQRRAEDAHLVLVAAKIGTWELDLLTNEVQCSLITDQLFGYQPQGTHRALADYLQRVHPSDVEQLSAAFTGLEGTVVHAVEFRIVYPDERMRWVALRGHVLRDRYDQPWQITGTLTDITERVQLEAQARHSQRLASIGRLAGGVAHDFNNLLTALIGYAELMDDTLESDHPARDDLLEVRKASNRAIVLTRQLLTFARHQPLSLHVVDLNTVITDMERLLQRLLNEDIEMILHLAPNLRSIRVDPGQIEQVIINLAVNARDAMPNGGRLVITTKNVFISEYDPIGCAALDPGSYVLFTISDTGIGMSEDVQRHVFEPFFTTKGQEQGTGLGMATCSEVVKHHGGHINIDSEPGHGTMINVYLPYSAVEVLDDGSLPITHLAAPHGTETVLLVEDDPAVRMLQARVLRDHGYTVLQAGNGVEALGLLTTYKTAGIDLLLTDIVMPQMGGIALTEAIRAIYPTIKTILMSGYADPALIQRDTTVKDIVFLAKPQLASMLLHRVREVLDGSYNLNCSAKDAKGRE